MMILLLGSNVAIAAENQSLTLTYSGVMVDIGTQRYRSSGGSVVSASVPLAGTTLSLTSAHLEYSIQADVKGNDVTGHASLELRGQDANLGPVSLEGPVSLTDMVPAVGFPLDPAQPNNPLACFPNCT